MGMKRLTVSLGSGVLFGAGLSLAQMNNPIKVLNFFDVVGNWDPSLAFVMVGALAVTFVAFRFMPKRSAPIFDDKFRIPTKTIIDKKLIAGAVLFGVGWGLSGYCPGPAVANLGSGFFSPLVFFIAMISGFMLHKQLFEPSSAIAEKQCRHTNCVLEPAQSTDKNS
jgi:uncharacterized protein